MSKRLVTSLVMLVFGVKTYEHNIVEMRSGRYIKGPLGWINDSKTKDFGFAASLNVASKPYQWACNHINNS